MFIVPSAKAVAGETTDSTYSVLLLVVLLLLLPPSEIKWTKDDDQVCFVCECEFVGLRWSVTNIEKDVHTHLMCVAAAPHTHTHAHSDVERSDQIIQVEMHIEFVDSP